ncbi:nucleotide sugar dehydrogenase [Paremcibacter congregatus]|uniref:UDP-N-acetyl-D-galactosamine dehydrogenase n=1 Tax=Paremcibacter congregatus TaxID=2043170 RepID=A0A2G4YUA7_9PROT|nr:nucleotide sugar dehydrogenase [Paremcibacter congregatus]PHZ85922.1 UDP-N-acetyl-D-galactosamine dehydrogenase [Paremcibacter congregatus]QDE26887.1 nucleotide sugar dehydrogenase [Paremcibacter congregatus]
MTDIAFTADSRIVVVGLGYVGLPLAVAMANKFNVVGFDISEDRVRELKDGFDRTEEVDQARLEASSIILTKDVVDIKDAAVYIVTVPTPVNDDNSPDLGPVRSSCELLGPLLTKGAIVVFESTVYPGVTEELCGPVLEETSGMECGKDFFLGYSPERINPGDKEHTVDKITKVISGQTPEVTNVLVDIYGAVTSGGTFAAASIRAAEAAKVIENSQRDINIAFVNEITMIFQKLGISVYDVLEAAGTKWNFLNFTPGLVGGHCIGVDPYYLAERARQVNHDPRIILSGRAINDSMADFVAERVCAQLSGAGKILVLGLTFKENCPDLRNTKAIDLIHSLRRRGFKVDVHDAAADPVEAKKFYNIDLVPSLDELEDNSYAAVMGVVSHDAYRALTGTDLERLLETGGLIADVKAMWRDLDKPKHLRKWQL